MSVAGRRGRIACALAAAAGCAALAGSPDLRRALLDLAAPASREGVPVIRATTREAGHAPAPDAFAREREPARLTLVTARSVAIGSLSHLELGTFNADPARAWPARSWPIQGWPTQSWLPQPAAQPAPAVSALAWSAVPLGLSPDPSDGEIEDARFSRAPHRWPPLRILQIGDSHTAADFFTGEMRDVLQARYGDGGLGLMVAGTPTPGVRSARLKLSASPGWSYQAIQKSGAVEHFALPGFVAEARKAGEVLGFAAETPARYTDIDLEVRAGPDEGAIEVDLDGRRTRYDLKADAPRHMILHLAARGQDGRQAPAGMRQLAVRTVDGRHVAIEGITFLNRRDGVSYSNIGFPGATVDIINKFPRETVVEGLRHLAPAIVVLSFGTNEGFNDKLDLARYEEQVERVLATVRAGAPQARIVMVGPSFAARVPAICLKEPAGKACEALRPVRPPVVAGSARSPLSASSRPGSPDGAAGGWAADAECDWPTPLQLDRVRDFQRRFAAAHGIPFWDWSSIMPRHCGAQTWATGEPRLMTADHVHFTKDGYRRSARAFAAFLDPIVRQALGTTHAVSND